METPPVTGRPRGRTARLLRRALTARGRSLEITRAGWLFIVLTLAVGFTAVNSGSNLLHIVFGAQMALIIGSGVLSESAVARATARRLPPLSVHAKTPAALVVELHNPDRRRDVLSVSVEDDDRHPSTSHCQPVFAVRIPAGKSVVLHSAVTMEQRGRQTLPPAVVATRFPFGLFIKRRDLRDHVEVTVYPRIHHVAAPPGGTISRGEGPRVGRYAREGEFFGLRDYREGDDPRHIHWPAVARTGRGVVREHESFGDAELILELAPGVRGSEPFEAEVERVASEAVAALRSPGLAVGLRYGGTLLLPPRSGAEQRRRVLETLAFVGARAEDP